MLSRWKYLASLGFDQKDCDIRGWDFSNRFICFCINTNLSKWYNRFYCLQSWKSNFFLPLVNKSIHSYSLSGQKIEWTSWWETYWSNWYTILYSWHPSCCIRIACLCPQSTHLQLRRLRRHKKNESKSDRLILLFSKYRNKEIRLNEYILQCKQCMIDDTQSKFEKCIRFNTRKFQLRCQFLFLVSHHLEYPWINFVIICFFVIQSNIRH